MVVLIEPLIPNATTAQAMQDARNGKLENITLDELQAVLDAIIKNKKATKALYRHPFVAFVAPIKGA